MVTHLSDDVLIDVLEGHADAAARAHAGSCAACGARLAEAREGLAFARGADAPEPSPLFFEAFPRRVTAALLPARGRRSLRWLFAPALLGAAVAVVIGVVTPRSATAPVSSPAPLPAWSVVAVENGEALDALGALEAAPEFTTEACGDVAECLADLDDEEGRAFAEALREELGEGGDL